MSDRQPPVTAADLAEALRALMTDMVLLGAEDGTPLPDSYDAGESLLVRFDAQQKHGVTLVPTNNCAVADTGDFDECCMVCGEPTDGGHAPDRCVDNILGGEKQAHDFLVEQNSSLENVAKAAAKAVALYSAACSPDFRIDRDSTREMDKAIEALRTALTASVMTDMVLLGAEDGTPLPESYDVSESLLARFDAQQKRAREATKPTNRRWYSIGLEGEFDEHDSPEEAKRSAEEWIDTASDNDEGWPEDVGRIEWGELVCRGYATETEHIDADDDDTGACERNDWTHICKYELHDASCCALENVAKAALDVVKALEHWENSSYGGDANMVKVCNRIDYMRTALTASGHLPEKGKSA